jgi:hypothetical protein
MGFMKAGTLSELERLQERLEILVIFSRENITIIRADSCDIV